MFRKVAAALIAASLFAAPAIAQTTAPVTPPAKTAPATPAKVATPAKHVSHVRGHKRHRTRHAHVRHFTKHVAFARHHNKSPRHTGHRVAAHATVKPATRTN